MRSLTASENASLVMAIGLDTEATLEWIGENLEPNDVFDDDTLNNWAASNGFVPKSE